MELSSFAVELASFTSSKIAETASAVLKSSSMAASYFSTSSFTWAFPALSASAGALPAPAFASSLAYVDQLRSRRLPAALIQGQRDFFGSHTYHRTDDVEGVYHTLWATPERTEEKWD